MKSLYLCVFFLICSLNGISQQISFPITSNGSVGKCAVSKNGKIVANIVTSSGGLLHGTALQIWEISSGHLLHTYQLGLLGFECGIEFFDDDTKLSIYNIENSNIDFHSNYNETNEEKLAKEFRLQKRLNIMVGLISKEVYRYPCKQSDYSSAINSWISVYPDSVELLNGSTGKRSNVDINTSKLQLLTFNPSGKAVIAYFEDFKQIRRYKILSGYEDTCECFYKGILLSSPSKNTSDKLTTKGDTVTDLVYNRKIKVFDWKTRKTAREIEITSPLEPEHSDALKNVLCTGNSYAATYTEDSMLSYFDFKNPKKDWKIKLEIPASIISYIDETRFLTKQTYYLKGDIKTIICLWKVNENKPYKRFDFFGNGVNIDFSSDKKLLSFSTDSILIYDIAAGRYIFRYIAPNFNCHKTVFCDSNNSIIAYSRGNIAGTKIAIKSAKKELDFKGIYVPKVNVKFINDSEYIQWTEAGYGKYGCIKKFNAYSGRQDTNAFINAKFINETFVSPNGRLTVSIPIQTSLQDRIEKYGETSILPEELKIRIWDNATGKAISSFLPESYDDEDDFLYGEFLFNEDNKTILYNKSFPAHDFTDRKETFNLEVRDITNGQIIHSKKMNNGYHIIAGNNDFSSVIIDMGNEVSHEEWDINNFKKKNNLTNLQIQMPQYSIINRGYKFYPTNNESYSLMDRKIYSDRPHKASEDIRYSDDIDDYRIFSTDLEKNQSTLFFSPTEIPYNQQKPIVSHNGKYVAVQSGIWCYIVFSQTGKVLDSIKRGEAKVAFSEDDKIIYCAKYIYPDGKPELCLEYITIGDSSLYNHIKLYSDIDSRFEFANNSTKIASLSISPNNQMVIVSLADQNINAIFDLRIHQLIYYSLSYGFKDLIVVDNKGRYDGSNDAVKNLYFICDDKLQSSTNNIEKMRFENLVENKNRTGIKDRITIEQLNICK